LTTATATAEPSVTETAIVANGMRSFIVRGPFKRCGKWMLWREHFQPTLRGTRDIAVRIL
jgi:hypothetical protein